MTEEPKRCRECRFYSNDHCLHEKSRSFTAIGDTAWALAMNMRENRLDGCGRDGKLWEAWPPLTTKQLIVRWGFVGAAISLVAACSFIKAG